MAQSRPETGAEVPGGLLGRIERAFVPDQLLPDGNVDPRAVQRRYLRMVGTVATACVVAFAPSMAIAGVPPALWLPYFAAVAATALVIALSLLAVPAHTRASLAAAAATALATFALDRVIGGHYHQAPVLYALLVAGFAIVQGAGAAAVMVAFGAVLVPLASRTPDGLNLVDNLYALIYLSGVAAVVWTRARLQDRADEAVRRSRAEYRELVEHMPAIVYKADPGADGRWRYVSPRVVDLLGYTAEEVMARPGLWCALLHPDDRERVLVDDAETSMTPDGRHTTIDYRILDRDGMVHWVHDEAVIVPESAGMAAHWSGFLLETTERKALEDQLRHAQRIEAVGQLAGGIAHDFNNLLTAIHGYGELIEAQLPADAAYRGDLEEMLRAADRASVLTRQLLAFSRRQVLQPEVLAPADVVEGLVPMLSQLLGTHIKLVTRHDEEPAWVAVDEGQLEQVIVNLAVNARDAMPTGGRLTIESGRVPADPDSGGDVVRISVADTGAGMDAATQARIFEPFFTTKGVGKGTGMGLATVHGIVQQSGGRIACVSAPGRGTTFTIELTRVASGTARVTTVAAAAPPRGTETILLVEDEEAVRTIGRRMLERLGYTVLDASSGAEALAVAATHEGRIDLLLTDVQMPQMLGPELARRIRAIRPGLPTVLMSGFTGDQAPALSTADHAAMPLLAKPFDAETLGRTVRRALDAGRDTQAPAAAGGASPGPRFG